MEQWRDSMIFEVWHCIHVLLKYFNVLKWFKWSSSLKYSVASNIWYREKQQQWKIYTGEEFHWFVNNAGIEWSLHNEMGSSSRWKHNICQIVPHFNFRRILYHKENDTINNNKTKLLNGAEFLIYVLNLKVEWILHYKIEFSSCWKSSNTSYWPDDPLTQKFHGK
jgi:hypothetical protein